MYAIYKFLTEKLYFFVMSAGRGTITKQKQENA